MVQVSVIIPARNEADRIAQTVRTISNQPSAISYQLSAISSQLEVEVIVVDDASDDETSEVAKQAGAAKVVRLLKHSGKGAALRRGIAEARGDILVFVDADLGETAQALWQLVFPVLNGEADMTIATPPPDLTGGGFGFVKKFSAWAIRITTGFQATAPLSGQRTLRREVLECVRIAGGYAVETALTIDAIRAGFRVMEVPIAFRHRALGKSWRGFLHRAKQLCDIALAVLPRLLKRR